MVAWRIDDRGKEAMQQLVTKLTDIFDEGVIEALVRFLGGGIL